MGYLRYLYDLTRDPTDTPTYTPYEFFPINLSLGRDWARRESVLVVPGADSVLDEYGRGAPPVERRDFAISVRIFSPDGNLDKLYDLLAAQVAPGRSQRLVYQTDAGGPNNLWYTIAYSGHIQHTTTSASNWGHGGFLDCTVTWRIRPYWTPRFSETAEVFHRGSVFHTGSTFGGLGTTAIASYSQPFTVDATGVAGVNLPTLPDTGPTMFISGPVGGSGGLRVYNFTATVIDTNGAEVGMYFDIPFAFPTSANGATLKFGSQIFTANGLPFRPIKPAYQRHYFEIAPGAINSCLIVAIDANGVTDPAGLTGGSIKVDWMRRRA